MHFKWIAQKIRKTFFSFVLLFQYRLSNYQQQCKNSWIYQMFLSKWLGLSIAQKRNQSIHLEYIFEGKKYEIYLPLNNRLKSKMINDSIELEKNQKKIKIQHQSGIPFLVTPQQIGVDKVWVYTIDDDKIFIDNQLVIL
jgi:hypothetical protein